MLTPEQALAKAKSTASYAVGMCDRFVAQMFGFSSSGYNRAIDNWNAVPVSSRHLGDTNAPAGSLMFWSGGSAGAGHVAISDGNGGVYSTDQPSPGRVSNVPASAITDGWHETYLGWTPPYFQGQMGSVGAAGTGNGSTVTQAGTTGTNASATSDILSSILGLGGGKGTKDLAERAGLILLGVILIVVGLWKFTAVGEHVQNPLKSSGKTRSENA